MKKTVMNKKVLTTPTQKIVTGLSLITLVKLETVQPPALNLVEGGQVNTCVD